MKRRNLELDIREMLGTSKSCKMFIKKVKTYISNNYRRRDRSKEQSKIIFDVSDTISQAFTANDLTVPEESLIHETKKHTKR